MNNPYSLARVKKIVHHMTENFIRRCFIFLLNVNANELQKKRSFYSSECNVSHAVSHQSIISSLPAFNEVDKQHSFDATVCLFLLSVLFSR